MGQEKEKEPKKQVSWVVGKILSEMKKQEDPSPWNGRTKDEVIDILNELEPIFRTFLINKDETPFIKFIDSDLEISSFLTKRRFPIPHHSLDDKDSILSYMRKELEKE